MDVEVQKETKAIEDEDFVEEIIDYHATVVIEIEEILEADTKVLVETIAVEKTEVVDN